MPTVVCRACSRRTSYTGKFGRSQESVTLYRTRAYGNRASAVSKAVRGYGKNAESRNLSSQTTDQHCIPPIDYDDCEDAQYLCPALPRFDVRSIVAKRTKRVYYMTHRRGLVSSSKRGRDGLGNGAAGARSCRAAEA